MPSEAIPFVSLVLVAFTACGLAIAYGQWATSTAPKWFARRERPAAAARAAAPLAHTSPTPTAG